MKELVKSNTLSLNTCENGKKGNLVRWELGQYSKKEAKNARSEEKDLKRKKINSLEWIMKK